MNTWTIINGDTLCLNGRPVASIYAPGVGENKYGRFEADDLTKDERRELLEELNRKDQ